MNHTEIIDIHSHFTTPEYLIYTAALFSWV